MTDIPKRQLPTDAAWRKRVVDRLDELGVRQYQLAEWVGASTAQISYLGDEERPTRRSEFVERISTALRVDLPLRAQLDIAADELEARGDHSGLRLTIANAEALLVRGRRSD